MNDFRLKLCVFIIIVFSSLILSQENNFDTHSLDLKGELSKDDAYQDNFGRFLRPIWSFCFSSFLFIR